MKGSPTSRTGRGVDPIDAWIPSPFQAIPASRARRWDLLREAVGQWHRPLAPSDGDPATTLDQAASRLGLGLPPALREWYALAGRREDVWSRQDAFLRPERLRIEDDRLVFYEERQAVVRWGLRVADFPSEDPPVFVSSADAPDAWSEEAATTSMFALKRFVLGVKYAPAGRLWGNGWPTETTAAAVESAYPRLPLPQVSWPGAERFFGHRDLLAGLGDGEGLWVATRTEAAFREFHRLLEPTGMEWQGTVDAWPRGW